MDKEERLRRRREQARSRRAAETPEQREARLVGTLTYNIHNSFCFFYSQCCSSNDRAGDGIMLTICIHVYVTILHEGSPHDVDTSV